MREKMVYGDRDFTVMKVSDGEIWDIFFYIGMRIDFTLFYQFQDGQRCKGFCQGASHEIGVFCNWDFFLGIRIPIALREYHSALAHQGDGSAGDPVVLKVIPDDCIESRYRTRKISLVKYRLIWVQGAAAQGKKDE
jgi:hypothetical protein